MVKSTESATNVNEVSRISNGTVIKGEVDSAGDLRIDGTFNGTVRSKGRVVVGEKSTVEGNIFCENLDLWGKATGKFFVKDTLALRKGCRVSGELHIRKLSVELGARFDGNCRMISESQFEEGRMEEVRKPVPAAAEAELTKTGKAVQVS